MATKVARSGLDVATKIDLRKKYRGFTLQLFRSTDDEAVRECLLIGRCKHNDCTIPKDWFVSLRSEPEGELVGPDFHGTVREAGPQMKFVSAEGFATFEFWASIQAGN